MKIILELACDGPEEEAEARLYVEMLKRRAERRKSQGFPGLILSCEDASIWASSAELVE